MSASEEKKLRTMYRMLDSEQRKMLMQFAEFLVSRIREQEPVLQQPDIIPRPETESVIGGIKRLSASYPMLDKAPILNKTSSLMTQHMMEGRPASEIIDELEVIFIEAWQTMQDEMNA